MKDVDRAPGVPGWDGRKLMFFRRLRDILTAVCLIVLLALIAAKLMLEGEQVIRGPFVAADGDSLVKNGERFRLSGIDAPELGQTCKRRSGQDWPCGQTAKALLARLVASRAVICRGGSRDRFDRLLVTCENGSVNLNAEMVRQGMAVAFGGYLAEEREARRSKVGLWDGDFAMPRDWRRTHGAGQGDEEHDEGWLGQLVGDWF